MPAEYSDAPQEVLDLVRKIIDNHPQADFAKAKVKYLMKSMKNSHWAGRCYLTHGPWKFLSDFDYVIIIWSEYWEAHEYKREPLLYHELCHIMKTERDTWALRQHPIQEFPEVIAEYGCWSPELACLKGHVRRPY